VKFEETPIFRRNKSPPYLGPRNKLSKILAQADAKLCVVYLATYFYRFLSQDLSEAKYFPAVQLYKGHAVA
jgi:hypothetical protein